jgi:hypothetical protein
VRPGSVRDRRSLVRRGRAVNEPDDAHVRVDSPHKMHEPGAWVQSGLIERRALRRDQAVPPEEALAAARGCLIAVALGAALWTLLVVAVVLAAT